LKGWNDNRNPKRHAKPCAELDSVSHHASFRRLCETESSSVWRKWKCYFKPLN